MQIAILLFDRITLLDAVGPYEVLARLPGATVEWVAREPGPKSTDAGATVVAHRALDEVTRPEVLLVPGGFGIDGVIEEADTLQWMREVHEHTRFTTSVCTGSLGLAAAGLLRELRATSHWNQIERLREWGAEPVSERIVWQGKIATAAGVSAGIDMAIALAAKLSNELVAQTIQLAIEYDPQPPYDTGHPSKAPEQAIELVREATARGRAAR